MLVIALAWAALGLWLAALLRPVGSIEGWILVIVFGGPLSLVGEGVLGVILGMTSSLCGRLVRAVVPLSARRLLARRVGGAGILTLIVLLLLSAMALVSSLIS